MLDQVIFFCRLRTQNQYNTHCIVLSSIECIFAQYTDRLRTYRYIGTIQVDSR